MKGKITFHYMDEILKQVCENHVPFGSNRSVSNPKLVKLSVFNARYTIFPVAIKTFLLHQHINSFCGTSDTLTGCEPQFLLTMHS